MQPSIQESESSVRWRTSTRAYSRLWSTRFGIFKYLFFRGNWGVDLQAGSQYGYQLLFIVLVSGLFALFLQVCTGSYTGL